VDATAAVPTANEPAIRVAAETDVTVSVDPVRPPLAETAAADTEPTTVKFPPSAVSPAAERLSSQVIGPEAVRVAVFTLFIISALLAISVEQEIALVMAALPPAMAPATAAEAAVTASVTVKDAPTMAPVDVMPPADN
jgi:hypothetical protein